MWQGVGYRGTWLALPQSAERSQLEGVRGRGGYPRGL